MKNEPIQVFEYDSLIVDNTYGSRVFEQRHLDALAKYKTRNEKTDYFQLLYHKVRFKQYVGVLKVGDLTIEVLPKTDRHTEDKSVWQKVLLEMLLISLQVEAKTTTEADISIRKHSVLETYLQLFIKEAASLIHNGLVKKYRNQESNQTALKGKLLVHHQVTKNVVHAERFFVSHSVYDKDNVYNYLIRESLDCIVATAQTEELKLEAQALLLYFPECKSRVINEKLFARLVYDRKTEGYKRALELARIILLNYHPDIKGGANNILAIMFDMNYLWESFITWSLKKASVHEENVKIKAQQKRLFWKHENNWNLRLKPDLLVEINGVSIVIDTKWKYRSGVSMEDIRQLYAYQHYFGSDKGYLLYPDKVDGMVHKEQGNFYLPDSDNDEIDELSCGLMFVDLLIKEDEKTLLNRKIGERILLGINSG